MAITATDWTNNLLLLPPLPSANETAQQIYDTWYAHANKTLANRVSPDCCCRHRCPRRSCRCRCHGCSHRCLGVALLTQRRRRLGISQLGGCHSVPLASTPREAVTSVHLRSIHPPVAE